MRFQRGECAARPLLPFRSMGAVIELLIIPTLLVTGVAIGLIATGVSAKTIFALGVAIALFYFVVVSLIRLTRQIDQESEAESHPRR